MVNKPLTLSTLMLHKKASNIIRLKEWTFTAQVIPRFLACILLISVWWMSISSPVAALSLPANSIVGALFHFSGSRPTNLGVQNGKLAPCPISPNCVSSQSQDSSHAIEPLRYSNPEEAFHQLKETIAALPEVQIITESDSYLYAEFTSALMGFVDDVEFYLDKDADAIQVRSASRLGESDLGVNRKRIESIRATLEESKASA